MGCRRELNAKQQQRLTRKYMEELKVKHGGAKRAKLTRHF